MPVIDGLPVSVPGGQIPPGRACAGSPQHPVDHRSMIGPPPTPAWRLVGQQRFQLRPLLISEVMAIVHRDDLSHPTRKIQGTRPKQHRPWSTVPTFPLTQQRPPSSRITPSGTTTSNLAGFGTFAQIGELTTKTLKKTGGRIDQAHPYGHSPDVSP